MPTPVLGTNAASGSGWLEAGETWTYVSADSPTFVFSVNADVTLKYSAGMRVQLTQTTVKYFIITAVGAFSAGATQITVYGGTDYTLANAAITAPYYSVVKAPFGFPLDPAKWTVQFTDVASRSQATPVSGTWYNIASMGITIPIGVWTVSYQVCLLMVDSAGGLWSEFVTLSTAADSESDVDFTAGLYSAATLTQLMTVLYREKTLSLAAKTAYYLNAKTVIANLDQIRFANDNSKLIIRAICAYL